MIKQTFSAPQAAGQRGEMNVSDTVETTRHDTFFCSVVWKKHLMEAGCIRFNGDGCTVHTEEFLSEMNTFNVQIQSKFLDDLPDKSRSLFPDHRNKPAKTAAQKASGCG